MSTARKRVAILGSTGSIGCQALDVIAHHADRFEVAALAARSNVELLAEQVRRFHPGVVSLATAEAMADLRARIGPAAATQFLSGAAGLSAVAAESNADVLLAATDGVAAFDAIFAAVDAGIDVAIANKEVVVAAGELLFERARRSGAALIPVDSEHSAIFQCLVGQPRERIAAVVLTASGGPFWTRSAASMRDVTVADAMRHPTWQMGVKNTIDSATMMNKGLEAIEASRFFGLPADRIEVLVHRTSIAHGFAIFTDGNVIGQFAPPDMRLPIGYALAYPDRLDDGSRFDPLTQLGAARGETAATLAFERPDLERFPCLALAFDALRAGGTAPAVLSAANEIAVAAFADGAIRFDGIARVVAAALAACGPVALSLDAIRAADASAREAARAAVAREGPIAVRS